MSFLLLLVSVAQAADLPSVLTSGTYDGDFNVRGNVRVAPGARVLIRGSVGFDTGVSGSLDGSAGQLTIDGGYRADPCVLCFNDSGPVTVINVEVTGGMAHGIFGAGDSLRLVGLDVHHNGITSGGRVTCPMPRGHCHGIYLASGTSSPNLRIEGGRYHDNEAAGLHLYGVPNGLVCGLEADHNGGHGIWPISGKGVTVAQNRVHDNGLIGDGSQGVGVFIGDSGALVANNVIRQNRVGILAAGGDATQLSGNTVSGNRDNDIEGSVTTVSTVSANLSCTRGTPGPGPPPVPTPGPLPVPSNLRIVEH